MLLLYDLWQLPEKKQMLNNLFKLLILGYNDIYPMLSQRYAYCDFKDGKTNDF